MSNFDKEKSCNGCPDRVVEPNCHMTCEGYLKRVAKRQLIKERHLEATKGTREAYVEKRDAIAKTKRRLGKKA